MGYLFSSIFMSLTFLSLGSLLISVDESLLQILAGILGSLFGLGTVLAGAMSVVVSMVMTVIMSMVMSVAMAMLVADSVVEDSDLDEVKAQTHN